MKNKRKNLFEKRLQALQCLEQGYNQKETAQKVGVTEKTIGHWAKDWNAEQSARLQNRKLFELRLNEMLNNPAPDVQAIMNLTKAMNEYKKH